MNFAFKPMPGYTQGKEALSITYITVKPSLPPDSLYHRTLISLMLKSTASVQDADVYETNSLSR